MFDALRKMILPIIIIVLVFFGAMIILEWGMGFSSRRDYVSGNNITASTKTSIRVNIETP